MERRDILPNQVGIPAHKDKKKKGIKLPQIWRWQAKVWDWCETVLALFILCVFPRMWEMLPISLIVSCFTKEWCSGNINYSRCPSLSTWVGVFFLYSKDTIALSLSPAVGVMVFCFILLPLVWMIFCVKNIGCLLWWTNNSRQKEIFSRSDTCFSDAGNLLLLFICSSKRASESFLYLVFSLQLFSKLYFPFCYLDTKSIKRGEEKHKKKLKSESQIRTNIYICHLITMHIAVLELTVSHWHDVIWWF